MIWVHGVRACECIRDSLPGLEARLGMSLAGQVTQGAYSTGVGASAGTHDGGGVWDLRPALGTTQRLRAFRESGWVAWLRTAAQGFQPHVHAVVAGCPHLSSAARTQISRYRSGLDGLAGMGLDDGPQVPYRTWREALPDGSGQHGPMPQPEEDDMFTDADRAQLSAIFTNASTTAQAANLAQRIDDLAAITRDLSAHLTALTPLIEGIHTYAATTTQAANLAQRIDDLSDLIRGRGL